MYGVILKGIQSALSWYQTWSVLDRTKYDFEPKTCFFNNFFQKIKIFQNLDFFGIKQFLMEFIPNFPKNFLSRIDVSCENYGFTHILGVVL